MEIIQSNIVEILLVGAAIYLFWSDRKESPASIPNPAAESVESSISNLILEAKAASEGLNEALLERRSELECLLKRLDEKERVVQQEPQEFIRKEASKPREEFPNESWLKPANKLQDLIEKTEDKVEVSSTGRTDERIAKRMGVDLALIKVARRLLVNGQEDFKVAKKLGLSLHDIKQLKAIFGINAPIPQMPKDEAIRKYNFGSGEAVNG